MLGSHRNGDLKMKRFANRWIVVTEAAHVVLKPTYRYRSYPRRGDAYAACDRASRRNQPFMRYYVVDRDNSPNVILP